MAIQISNWVTELQKRTNLQGTDRILMGISSTGESLYTTVADLAGVVTSSTVVNRGEWASGTEYTQGDYVFAESTASPTERSMYFLIGIDPYVSNIPPKDDLSKWSELPAIKGDQGPKGDKGDKGDPLTWDDLTPAQKDSLKGDVGDSGWSMLVRAEVDNVNLDSDGQYRKVLYVYDWVGGEGTKPTITGYIGVSGIVADIVNAENWRGSRGAQGIKGDAPAHEWVGTSVRFQNPNGTWGALTDLQGAQGIQGIQGDPPAHEWNGSSLRFQNPDGSWGAYVDLKGEKGDMGDGLEIGASGPLSGRSAYDSEPVNFVYWATDENLFYIRANPTGWSTGQSLGAVANFLQLDDTPSSYSGSGGKVVAVKNDASGLEFVEKDAPQTLSLGTAAGNIAISDGNSVALDSLNRAVFSSSIDGFLTFPVGFHPYFYTIGSTGFPSTAGNGIAVIRTVGTFQGGFFIDKTNSNDGVLRYAVGNSSGLGDWEIFASRRWVNAEIIGTAGQLPFTNSAGTGIEKRRITPADLNMFTVGTILGNIAGNLGELSLSSSVENSAVAQRTTYGSLKASNAVANDDLVALGQLNTRFSNLATVANTGDYDDLSNKPTLGTAASKDVGVTEGDVVEVQAGGKLPALDGSDLTNLPIPSTWKGFKEVAWPYVVDPADDGMIVRVSSYGAGAISLADWDDLPIGFSVTFISAAGTITIQVGAIVDAPSGVTGTGITTITNYSLTPRFTKISATNWTFLT